MSFRRLHRATKDRYKLPVGLLKRAISKRLPPASRICCRSPGLTIAKSQTSGICQVQVIQSGHGSNTIISADVILCSPHVIGCAGSIFIISQTIHCDFFGVRDTFPVES